MAIFLHWVSEIVLFPGDLLVSQPSRFITLINECSFFNRLVKFALSEPYLLLEVGYAPHQGVHTCIRFYFL